jgi:isopentenyl-diphosphate Delta-isomerase
MAIRVYYGRIGATRDSLEEDLVVLVDDEDEQLGYGTKEECHTVHDGLPGYHHRGLTVLVHDGRGRVLLQHRKHRIFDNVWDLAGSTHPYFRGGRQEGYEEAALRCLKTEYSGFEDAAVTNSSISVNYSAIDSENGTYCENEFCRLVVSVHDPTISHNAENAYGHEWVSFGALIADLERNPRKYAPWVVDLLEMIQKEKPSDLRSLILT